MAKRRYVRVTKGAICTTQGCVGAPYARGMCQKCYSRWHDAKRPKRVRTSAQKAALKIYYHQYYNSAKGQVVIQRYRGSLAWAEVQKRCHITEKGRAATQRYENSDKRKAGNRRRKATEKCLLQKRAQEKAQYAIKTGKLTRPETCEFCDDPPTMMHHSDYDKPLDVTHICRGHHDFLHINLY